MPLKQPPFLKLALLGTAALFIGYIATAIAQEAPQGRPAPMDPTKMEAVRACAKAKGVDMPSPPPKGEHGRKSERPAGPPPESKDGGPQGVPPRLSEEQRKIIDACFEANGLTPPRGRPH